MGIEGVFEIETSPEATTFKFVYDGQLIEWSKSHARATIDGGEVPAWVSQRRHGRGGPDMFIKVAVRDGSPEVVELTLTSQPGQSEVQQKHLLALDLNRLAIEMYALEVSGADYDADPSEWAREERIAEEFIERQRLPRDYRNLTDEVLEKVAEVYKKNIRHAPTQAVAKHFGVKARMASTYVDRARKRGYLPPTKQGRKKA